MKNVMITGASGFVGRQTLLALLQKYDSVHAIYSKVPLSLTHPKLHWHAINLLDTNAVSKALTQIKPSDLLHLAWFAKPEVYWTSLINVDWLQCSLHLLKMFALHGGKRAVFIGTCAEYDWKSGLCSEKHTPCLPETLYGRSKYALHLLAESLSAEFNLSFAWARLFFLFGQFEALPRLVSSAIQNLLLKQTFIVKNGDYLRDFLYTTDVADALVRLLHSTIQGPINIASGQAIRIQDLLTIIGDQLKAQHLIQYETSQPCPTKMRICADTSRLQHELNWQPQYSLEEALSQTITWWKKVNAS